jgi:hypothetical protein
MSRILCCGIVILMLLGLSACGFFVPRQPDPKLAGELAQLVYPADAALGNDLDIVVIRNGGHIELVNRTATVPGPSELWLNQQYVGAVKSIPIGRGNQFDLVKFINEHGEAYPIGAVLQPDKSFPIVLAELFDPKTGLRHRLLVREELQLDNSALLPNPNQ